MSGFEPKQLNPTLKSISRVAGWLWKRGWAEWGAGNISFNVSDVITDEALRQHAQALEFNAALKKDLNLQLLLSVSGSKMRDIKKDPQKGLCMLSFNNNEKPITIPLSHKQGHWLPTSEYLSHLMIQDVLMKFRPSHKVVLHTHPAEIIAFPQIKCINNTTELNDTLSGVLPELKIYLPEGVAYIPFLEPGSLTLAEASALSLEKSSVAIWEKHGIIATGPTPEDAFDAIDLVVKATRTWLLIQSAAGFQNR